MDGQKQSYYINIQSNEIFTGPYDGKWDYKIEATESEVNFLKRLINRNDETDWESYFRSHIPYLGYQHQNREDDQRMLWIYTMLYDLGDEKTRSHIRNMGILNEDIQHKS
ncbi:hydrolase [Neobacillus sp. DY30]|uniref:hydrolase n=1 Tax=Neobacillus sp. DY30 TaxID=3047871 RepID=UPI0024BF6FE2|nr:hydrolase [Neobacillus sp. DY30]WHY03308.1 hydrolase [Neobacillus sp. DY30]